MVKSDPRIQRPFTVGMINPFGRIPTPQPGAPATSAIRGRVLGNDGRRVSYSDVRLVSETDPRAMLLTRADADGQYAFGNLPAGAYRVAASAAGYAAGASGEFRSPLEVRIGRVIELNDAQTRDRVDLMLARWGTIMGRVVDENGEPVQDANVQALQVRYQNGRRRLEAAAPSRLSDDRGEYRLFGLAPGAYVISAAVGAVFTADVPGYVRSYFPGTPNAAEARFVTLGPSADVTAVDVPLFRAKTARISGQLLNAAGIPWGGGGGLTLLASSHGASLTNVSVGARILEDGRFEFPNVPPGQYVIQARRSAPSRAQEGEFVSVPLVVNGTDLANLLVQTSVGSSITGFFTFDSTDPAKVPRRDALELVPTPVDLDRSPSGGFARADINADSTFRLAGLNGPRRLQLLRTPPGWMLKEIRLDGIDITDAVLALGGADQSLNGVEVVLTDRITQLGGTVTDERAVGMPDVPVILFGLDRERWYSGSRFLLKSSSGLNGTFSIEGVPNGSYYIAAVRRRPDDGEDGWQDPDFLESLRLRASRIQVGDAQTVSIGLRVLAP